MEHMEVNPIPEVADTCLGFTVVAMVEVFSELEKRDEEVGSGSRACFRVR